MVLLSTFAPTVILGVTEAELCDEEWLCSCPEVAFGVRLGGDLGGLDIGGIGLLVGAAAECGTDIGGSCYLLVGSSSSIESAGCPAT